MSRIISAHEAFAQAQREINAKLAEQGVAGLGGSDIALIAAQRPKAS